MSADADIIREALIALEANFDNPALAALDRLVKRVGFLEREYIFRRGQMLDERSRAESAEAALRDAQTERDDYRFWNERVRTCELHTQDVAAPAGDCLICNIATAEAERDRLLTLVDEMLASVLVRPVVKAHIRAARSHRVMTGRETLLSSLTSNDERSV